MLDHADVDQLKMHILILVILFSACVCVCVCVIYLTFAVIDYLYASFKFDVATCKLNQRPALG